jgi:hypothetical protein
VIYCILHARSLNKFVPHLRALRCLGKGVTIVLDDEPCWGEWSGVNILLTNLNNTEEVISLVRRNDTPEYFFTVSENLLPLVADLEEYFGLKIQVPKSSAEILSDKYKFSSFMVKNFPRNIVPHFQYLDSTFLNANEFNDVPFLVKPTVGSGSNLYFRSAVDEPIFEYIRFRCKNDFIKSLENSLFLLRTQF